jgi:hypothetical protein
MRAGEKSKYIYVYDLHYPNLSLHRSFHHFCVNLLIDRCSDAIFMGPFVPKKVTPVLNDALVPTQVMWWTENIDDAVFNFDFILSIGNAYSRTN